MQRAGVRYSKDPKLYAPEKLFVKLRPAYSVKLVFSHVVKGIKIKTTAKFRDAEHLRFEDTKRIMSPEKLRDFRETGPWARGHETIKYIYIYMFWHSATSLWLVADFASVASYTSGLFRNIKPSRPRFCQVTTQRGQTTTPGTPCPTSEMNEFIVVASAASLKCGNVRNKSVPNKGARYQNDICCRSIALEGPCDQSWVQFFVPRTSIGVIL